MKILVTGGAGFIGSSLCEKLVEENHDVVVIDDFSSGDIINLTTILDKIELIKTDCMLRKSNDYYFGLPDAGRELADDLVLTHLERGVENDIKAYDRNDGKQIIVGIKGSGKTDLRRFIESTDKAHILNLDADNAYLNIDAEKLIGRSGRIKNVLALELVRAFAEHMEESAENRSPSTNKLKKASEKALKILKNIPNAVEVNTGYGKVNLAELLRASSGAIVQSAWKNIVVEVCDSLKNKRGYIMIDDAEDVFPGIENNPDFLEGLVRAIYDINRETKSRLHVLLFLKYGIWRHWFENQKEYDKVSDIVVFLSWNHKSLCEIIGRRIAVKRRISKQQILKKSTESLWRLDFYWPTKLKFDKFASFVTEYCVSGPRDIIAL